MRVTTCYGGETVPRTVTVTSTCKCPFCKGKPKLKKGDTAVLMASNSGPTGRFYICMLHARDLWYDLGNILPPDEGQ